MTRRYIRSRACVLVCARVSAGVPYYLEEFLTLCKQKQKQENSELTEANFMLFNSSIYDLKRKTRTSDSDSEAKSPDGKKICTENTIADDKREAAITINREEDKAFESTSTKEEITKQLKFILSKLEDLETKVETAIETVNQLQTTVNRLGNTVEKVQEDAKQLKKN